MSTTPPNVLKTSGATAELVERLTISSQGQHFRMELHGENGVGAAGVVARVELQRILQMLQAEVVKAQWLGTAVKSPAAPAVEETGPKPARH
jgi:hypothetical protein